MSQSDELFAILRKALRGKGITQQSLAKKCSVSLATAKRWLAGKGVSTETLLVLMNHASLTFEDLASLIPSQNSATFSYTLDQETFFSKNPFYLAYFDQLLTGKTPSQIQRRFNLNDKSTIRYLNKLDRLGVIELHPQERVKLKVVGEPRWRKKGPLSTLYRAKAVSEFISHTNGISMSLLQVNSHDKTQLDFAISKLMELARSSDKRGRAMTMAGMSHGLLVGFAPFSWSLLQEVKNL